MLTWRELPKRDFESGVAQRREELNFTQRAQFRLHVTSRSVQTTTCIKLKFRFINADHHHLWGEFGCKGCVSCGWSQREGVAALFLQPARNVQQVGERCRFFGVDGDVNTTVHQPILHNCKGLFSRLAGVVGRSLDGEDRLIFLEAISSVATRYAPPQTATR